MSDLPPPDYTSFSPQILITPAHHRSSFLSRHGQVEGIVFVKGLGLEGDGGAGERIVERLSIHLTLKDTLESFPPLILHQTEPAVLYPSPSLPPGSRAEAKFPSTHQFTFPLSPDPSSLPGCVHLDEPGTTGEVSYELEVVLALRAKPGQQGGEEVREKQVIHITPYASSSEEATPQPVYPPEKVPYAPPTSSSGNAEASSSSSALPTPSYATPDDQVQGVKELIHGKSGIKLRLILASSTVRVGESLPVGVEFSVFGPGTDFSSDEIPIEERIPEPRGLRRIKLELHRRILLPPLPSEQSTSSLPPQRTHSTLLHASGKSCRYSPPRPVRLLFHLPSHPTTSSHGICAEITQETPYHEVRFFVRAIAGFATGRGREEKEVVVEKEVEVTRAVWTAEEAVVGEEDGEEEELERVRVLAERLGFEDEDLPETEEGRREAYRRKGRDIVGDQGTTRAEERGEGSSSVLPPPFGEVEDPDPPPFVAVAEREETPPTGGNGLPSFQESQSTVAPAPPPTRQPSLPNKPTRHARTPSLKPLTGELATWTEYDGYENFSQPPPPATRSLGNSSSMDLPAIGEDDAPPGVPAAAGDRMRLMEELGLGEGTRVVDMQGDMPPGIDEPSLPALPNALLAHHHPRHLHGGLARPAGLPITPPGFAEESPAVLPALEHLPPTFAASEAAEAQGGSAQGEVIIPSAVRAEAPPSYETRHGAGGGEEPPSYT